VPVDVEEDDDGEDLLADGFEEYELQKCMY
jgi:hypothetical protein